MNLRNQEQRFRESINRYEIAGQGVNMAHEILERAKDEDACTYEDNVVRYIESGEEIIKVSGHQYYARFRIGGYELEAVDYIFDNPETGEAEGCYIIGGDELLKSSDSYESATRRFGAEGPFGLIFYTDDIDQTVEGVQARCFLNGEAVDVPNDVMRETLVVLRSNLDQGNIEFASNH